MTINVAVEPVTTASLAQIPLRITADAGHGNIERIVIGGVPDFALLSVGTRRADGSWEVSPSDLPNAQITFSRLPEHPINITAYAEGKLGAQNVSGSGSGLIAVERTKGVRFQNVIAAALLVIATAAFFVAWGWLYQKAQDVLARDWEVSWEAPPDITLGAGPVTFWYDRTQKKLHHRGPVDSKLKIQLLELAHVVPDKDEPQGQGSSRSEHEGTSGPSTAIDDPRIASYTEAINQLAFKSNELLARYFWYLLSLAGLSGMLGAQIRAFANFIYISTTRNSLNIGVWWPWYALRPLLGFLLGLMGVLLVEGRFFVPGTETPPTGTAWWMAFAMLIGFAADDFAQRLRLVGQALFGKEK